MENLTGFLGPKHEPNCGVTAVAVATKTPFDKVWSVIKHGRKYGPNWKGHTYLTDRLYALDVLGAQYAKVYQRKWRNEKANTLVTWTRRLKPGRTYMIDLTGHTIVYRDGRVVDQFHRVFTPLSECPRMGRKRVNSVLEILGA